jgi:hypothetical protein
VDALFPGVFLVGAVFADAPFDEVAVADKPVRDLVFGRAPPPLWPAGAIRERLSLAAITLLASVGRTAPPPWARPRLALPRLTVPKFSLPQLSLPWVALPRLAPP